jgi:hypothetical protein
MKAKVKAIKRKATRKSSDASGGYSKKSARKFRRGGRIEAYTFGEALGSKNWP